MFLRNKQVKMSREETCNSLQPVHEITRQGYRCIRCHYTLGNATNSYVPTCIPSEILHHVKK